METNRKKKKYNVEIKEIHSRVIEVEATSKGEAEDIIADGYYNLDIILGAGDNKSVLIKAERGTKNGNKFKND